MLSDLTVILNNPIVIDYYKNKKHECFLETGTHTGSTIQQVCNKFARLFSIEISPYYYQYAKSVLSKHQNVQLFLGDSTKILPEILPQIKENIIYFLDGHYSSENTGKGDKDCPLIEELQAIVQRNNDDIIIIDDYRMFGTKGNEDWTDITEANILSVIPTDKLLFKDIIGDRFCIFLKSL